MKKALIGCLIGKAIEVEKANNKSLVGMRGSVIDETRNMLLLKTEKGIKKLIKKQVIIKILENGKN